MIETYIKIDAFSQRKMAAPNGDKLNSSPRNMGKNDIWIAATAYVIGAELITSDGDFDHLNGGWLRVTKFKDERV
ncbi:MAG: hypothetical protein JJU02_02425 [Cryomorphaceae bacterium]|nr:hypothetical protein [Cryomorphaceae bacterium]